MNRKMLKYLLLIMLPLSVTCCSTGRSSSSLTPADPESAGFSSERLERIDSMVRMYIEQGNIPGATVLIARKGHIVCHKSFGLKDITGNEALKVDDIYRIASMTKALTTVAAMMLYEEGHFLLDEPVSKYIPEFREPEVLVELKDDLSYVSRPTCCEITIRQLMTHTSGICYPVNSPDVEPLFRKHGIVDGFVPEPLVLGDVIRRLGSLPLMHDPGERFTYGLNIDVLGYLVEIWSGMSLEDFFEKRLFSPLGMEDSHFYLPAEKHGRLVPVYENTGDGLNPSGELMYGYPVKGSTYFSGGSGVSCTILDFAKFLQMMLNKGYYNGHHLLSRKTVDLMTMDQAGEVYGEADFGLGLHIVTEETKHRTLGSVGNYGWDGYFSTSYWVDPGEELIGLLFLQMAPFWYDDIHEKFQVLAYQALVGE